MELYSAEITTTEQLFRYLNRGEIITWKTSDKPPCDCYLSKAGDKFKIIIQPLLGGKTEATGDNKKNTIESIFNKSRHNGAKFYVQPGAYLESKNTTLFEKMIDKSRDILKKDD